MLKTNQLAISTALLALTFPSAFSAPEATNVTPVPTVLASLTGCDPTTIDKSIPPCQDFYHYANGLWLKRNTIPPDRSVWTMGSEARMRDLAALKKICEDAANNTTASPASNLYKVGAFYRTGMDTSKLEREGISPIRRELAQIETVKDRNDLAGEMARLHRNEVDAAFSFYVGADAGNSSVQIPQLYQADLGMPDRNYYLDSDADTLRVRRAYIQHVNREFELLGDSSTLAKREAAIVMRMETLLAKASQTDVEQRDPLSTYHKMTLAQLQAISPGMAWKRYFEDTGIARPEALRYNVNQPCFFQELSAMMSTNAQISDWRVYLRLRLLASASPYLASRLEKENFAFNGAVITGASKMPPRWQRVETTIDSEIGEALGKLYVEQTFSPGAKAKAKVLILSVKAVLRARLAGLDWMSEPTRLQAVAKCDAIAVKVGYPDKWRNYSSLRLDDQSYWSNVERANVFDFQRNLNKIGKPIDRFEWGLTASTINASYDPSTNSITFPAAILQPPFFDPKYDDAVNYGQIGAVVGHELTHGFDDAGRKYDAHGNLRNRWTQQDAANFTKRADFIIKQYSAYSPLPGLHVNGDLTQGENIADIGGLKLAYIALENTIADKPRAEVDGLTSEQRFFIAYAQHWRALVRPEHLQETIVDDPHAPFSFRVNGPCYDLPEFFQAFGCPVPDSAKQAGVW